MNCPRCKWPMFSLGPNQISKEAFLCIYCGDTAFLLDVPAEPEPTAFQGFSRFEEYGKSHIETCIDEIDRAVARAFSLPPDYFGQSLSVLGGVQECIDRMELELMGIKP